MYPWTKAELLKHKQGKTEIDLLNLHNNLKVPEDENQSVNPL